MPVIKAVVVLTIFIFVFATQCAYADAEDCESDSTQLYLVQTHASQEFDAWVYRQKKIDSSYEIPKYPFFAGIVCVKADGYLSYIAKDKAVVENLDIFTKRTNENRFVFLNELSRLVTPAKENWAMGHQFVHSIHFGDPLYLDGVKSALEDMEDYKVVRITRGEKPDPDWQPDLMETILSGKTLQGRPIFLEIGAFSADLQRIIREDGKHFAAVGISESQIPGAIMQAATTGRVVGHAGRYGVVSIYEATINGELKRIAVTAGNNGFIVEANPVSPNFAPR